MIFVGFPIFILFLSAAPLFGAVCLKRRPERLFAAGLLVNGLLFYFFCAADLCEVGFYLLFAANLSLYVPAARELRRRPGAFREFATPAVTTLYAALTAGFLLSLGEHPMWWDEFSHWASSAKFLFEYGKLNCEFPDLLGHASYPPGLAVLDTLVHKCFVGVGYRDFMPRFAVRAAKCCVFVLPFGDGPARRRFCECAAGMAFFWLVASCAFPTGNFSCESDCILGVVFAAAVYVAMRRGEDVGDDLLLALFLAWLVLIKKAGMGFAVMTLALYAVRRIADRRSGRTPKPPAWTLIVVFAAPFLAQASWSLLLKIHATPIRFPVGEITPARIWRLVRYGEPAYCREIAARFGMGVLRKLPLFFAMLGGVLLYRVRAGDRPRRTEDLLWFLPLAFAVYLVSLFLTYMFIFNRYQAHELVSFHRYLNGFLVMPAELALMLAFSSGGTSMAYRAFTSRFALTAALVAEAWFYHREHVIANDLAKSWPADRIVLEKRFGRLLRAPGARFVAVSGAGNGLYHPILKYEYGRHFADETPLDSAEGSMTPAELREFVSRARYVLIVRPPADMAQRCGELWGSPPELNADFTLFEVAPDGLLRPVR